MRQTRLAIALVGCALFIAAATLFATEEEYQEMKAPLVDGLRRAGM